MREGGRLKGDDLITGAMRFEYELNPTLAAFLNASDMNYFEQADGLRAASLPFRMDRTPDE